MFKNVRLFADALCLFGRGYERSENLFYKVDKDGHI